MLGERLRQTIALRLVVQFAAGGGRHIDHQRERFGRCSQQAAFVNRIRSRAEQIEHAFADQEDVPIVEQFPRQSQHLGIATQRQQASAARRAERSGAEVVAAGEQHLEQRPTESGGSAEQLGAVGIGSDW